MPPEIEDINDDIIRTKSSVDDPDLSPSPQPETEAALDAMAAEAEKAAAAPGRTVDDNGNQVEKSVLDKSPSEDLKGGAASAATAPAADAKGTPAPEAAPPPADELEKVALPPHVSQKAADSFATLKKVARETQAKLSAQLTERDTELKTLREEVTTLKSKVGSVPEEVTTELAELRKFRLSHDVESDPTFKKYDGEVSDNIAAIYKKLESAGMTKENVEKIKALGGPNQIDWEPILDKLPLATRRFIEAKLVSNEDLVEKKAKALEEAKKNAEGFLKERSLNDQKQVSEKAVSLLGQFEWAKERQVPASAGAEEKAAIEASNRLARESNARLREFVKDKSPAAIAELAVGTVAAYKFKADADMLSAQVKSLEEKVAALTKERDEAKAKFSRVKEAEAPRLRGDANHKPSGKAKSIFSTPGAEALDELYRQMQEQQD